MKFNEKNHPFDTATQLAGKSGIYYGQTSEFYANMVGPFGCGIAATLLRVMMEHPYGYTTVSKEISPKRGE